MSIKRPQPHYGYWAIQNAPPISKLDALFSLYKELVAKHSNSLPQAADRAKATRHWMGRAADTMRDVDHARSA